MKEENKNSHTKYRADIDGLRAVAVLSVVGFHAFPSAMKGGFIGVDIFFLISGLLISTIIFESLGKGEFSILEFYHRRIRRIFPALLLVLACSLAVGWFTLVADEYKQLGRHVAAGAGFAANLVLWSESGYFDNSAETKPLLHLWSLGVEEQFYILWPVVLWLIWKRKVPQLVLCILALCASFFLNIETVEVDPEAAFYSPLTRFWELLSGSLLAWWTLYKNDVFRGAGPMLLAQPRSCSDIRATRKVSGVLSNAFSVAGALLLAYGFYRITKESKFPGAWAVIPVLGAMFLIHAGPGAWINKNILSSKIAVWFGLVSYPLYLWHWPLLSFVRIIEGEAPSRAVRTTAVALSIILAWLTFRFVELPIRSRARGKPLAVCLCVLMFAIGLAGYTVHEHDGLKDRQAIQLMQSQSDDMFLGFHRMSGWLCDSLPHQDSWCIYSGSPTVVIIGDSHAPAVYFGLKPVYASQGKDVALFGGAAGCPPLLNVVSNGTPGQDRLNCIAKATEPLNIIINTPSIEEVVLTSRGPLYTTSHGFGNIEGDRFGHWALRYSQEPDGHRTNSEVFFGALEATLDALLSSGKKVTYLLDVPELGFDIRACLSRRSLLPSSQVKDPCAVSRHDFEERNREFRSQVSRVLATRPAVKVVDLSEALCDAHYCYGSRDGAMFYSDDDHLSLQGARYVGERLRNQFR